MWLVDGKRLVRLAKASVVEKQIMRLITAGQLPGAIFCTRCNFINEPDRANPSGKLK
jgi:hypothetical protein